MDKSNVISLPLRGKQRGRKRKKRIRNIDGIKYFNEKQIKALRRSTRDQAELDKKKDKITGIREWMVIDLLTSSGLRVSEAANVRCVDLKIGYAQSEVFVREGKDSISGHVEIPDSLKKHLKRFLKWKEDQGEGIKQSVSMKLIAILRARGYPRFR